MDAAQGPVYLYVLALIHARLGDHAAAFATLDRLFSVPGFYNEVWVTRDPGFAALRRHPAFFAYADRWSSPNRVDAPAPGADRQLGRAADDGRAPVAVINAVARPTSD